MRNAFAHPWLLMTVPALIVLAVLAWRSRRVRKRLCDRLGWGDGRGCVRNWPAVVTGLSTGLGLLLLVLGSAGPQWGWDWEQTAAPGRNVVVVLDRSRSMLAETPTRLGRCRTALLDWAAQLRRGGYGPRLGLIVFAAKAKVACPLTADYDHFRDAISAIDPELADPDLAATDSTPSGTRMGLALRAAVAEAAAYPPGTTDIIMLSDGDDPVRDGEWAEGASVARAARIPVFAVGIGDPDKASNIPAGPGDGDAGAALQVGGKPVRTSLEEGPLREIASATGGRYEAARLRVPPLGSIYSAAIAPSVLDGDNGDALPVYRQRQMWFLMPAFTLLALAMLLAGGPRALRRS